MGAVSDDEGWTNAGLRAAVERDEARAQVAQLERNLDEMGVTQNDLITEVERLRREIDRMERDLERERGESTEQYVDATNEVERLRARVAAAEGERDAAEAKCEDLAMRLRAVEAELVNVAIVAQVAADLRARAWKDHPPHDLLCIDGAPPPAWSVVCDDVPDIVHARDDGHVCANPRPRVPR
jgi:seryl-tRNA synthetase